MVIYIKFISIMKIVKYIYIILFSFYPHPVETVDNYVQKKILDSSNYWNLNDSKKMVIHRARWIKSYTISDFLWITS